MALLKPLPGFSPTPNSWTAAHASGLFREPCPVSASDPGIKHSVLVDRPHSLRQRRPGFRRDARILAQTPAIVATPGDLPAEAGEGKSVMDRACGFYVLQPHEKEVFSNLYDSLSLLIRWMFLLGTVDIGFPILNFLRFKVAPSVLDVFYSTEAFIFGGLLIIGQSTFRRLNELKKNKSSIPVLMEGIQRLTLAFLQIGALAAAITLLQTMEVAAKFPAVVAPFSIVLVAFALVRGFALRTIVTRYEPGSGKMAQLIGSMQRGKAKEYPLLDRLSLRLVGGQLLGYTFMGANGSEQLEEDKPQEYEFSNFEENIVRMLIDALRVAGVAILFEASSNVLRGAVGISMRDYGEIYDAATDTVDNLVTSLLLFRASASFDSVISTQGRDMTHITAGFGSEGLTALFRHLAKLIKGLFIANIVGEIVFRMKHWGINPVALVKGLIGKIF